MSGALEKLKADLISTVAAALVFGGLIWCLELHVSHQYDHLRYSYNRFHAVVVEINANQQISEDKFRSLQCVNTARFRIIDHRYPANTFFILRSYDSRLMTDAWVYNHHVGDTVYFDYIRDSRVFQIRGRS